MPITVICPQCLHVTQAPDAMAGQSGRCPCGATLSVPPPPAPRSTPAPVPAAGASPSRSNNRTILTVVTLAILLPLFAIHVVRTIRSLARGKDADPADAARAAGLFVQSRLPPGMFAQGDATNAHNRGPGSKEWEVAVIVSGSGPASAALTGTWWVTMFDEGKSWRLVTIKSDAQTLHDLLQR